MVLCIFSWGRCSVDLAFLVLLPVIIWDPKSDIDHIKSLDNRTDSTFYICH